MRKQNIFLLVVITFFLIACTTPKINTEDLKTGIDAARSGHYGQAMLHQELSEKDLGAANRILSHLEKGYYWNIDEKQIALDAAKSAAQHRLESEKEMCRWLTSVHSQNHHKKEAMHDAAVFFKTGSAIPFEAKDESILRVGRWLQTHPDATATVTASTDTVGNPAYNQNLSERRADAVVKRLIANGARPNQLMTKAIGEVTGADNTANQENRVVTIITTHPDYFDCPTLK